MRTLTILTALLVAAAVPTLAAARENPGVLKDGTCSNGAGWKLKAKHDDGLIDVEFEVDQNVLGRVWAVTLRRNGTRVFRGVRTTRPPSGSFEVNRRIRNRGGPDRMTAVARAAAGGTCRAALTI